MERGEEVKRTRIMPVRSSTYAFSLSIRSVNGLYFGVLTAPDGDTGDRGMSRPDIRVRRGDREAERFSWDTYLRMTRLAGQGPCARSLDRHRVLVAAVGPRPSNL